MAPRTRILAAVGLTVLLFLGIQFGALLLVEPLHEADRQAVENPDDPANSFVYFAVILLATAFMLGAFKYGAHGLIQALVIGVSILLAWFVFVELLPAGAVVAGLGLLPLLAAASVGIALLAYPEWYVIDAAGVLMGAGAAGLFGISFGLLPAIVFLVVLAVYDAISVYRTEHMLDLAGEVLQLRVPVVLVIPTTRSFSFLDSGEEADSGAEGSSAGDLDGPDTDPVEAASSAGDIGADDPSSVGAQTEPTGSEAVAIDSDVDRADDTMADEAAGADGRPREQGSERGDEESAVAAFSDRDALFVGLGDAVIPTILVASAAYFLPVAPIDVPMIALNVPALGAMLGTMAGLLVLLYMVLQGRPHAGLPLLNGGAIGGYLLGAIASGVSIVTALGL